MTNKQYCYPRVVQIMPCSNMWFRYDCKEGNFFWYSKVPCMALIENIQSDGKIFRDVRYIDCDSLGVFDEEPNFESVIYCQIDLFGFQHDLNDERHPIEIMKEGKGKFVFRFS